jgi:hypothetical protein
MIDSSIAGRRPNDRWRRETERADIDSGSQFCDYSRYGGYIERNPRDI